MKGLTKYVLLVVAALALANCGGDQNVDQVKLANDFAADLRAQGFDFNVAKAITERGRFAVFLNEFNDFEAVDLRDYDFGDDAFVHLREEGSVSVRPIGGGDFEDAADRVYSAQGAGFLRSLESAVVNAGQRERIAMTAVGVFTYGLSTEAAYITAAAAQNFLGLPEKTEADANDMVGTLSPGLTLAKINEAGVAEGHGDTSLSDRLIDEAVAYDNGINSSDEARAAINMLLSTTAVEIN